MVKVWIYTAILAAILITCIVRKQNILSVVLWGSYTVIGIFAIIGLNNGMFQSFLGTGIWPYLYLILVYAISFFPFTGTDGINGKKFVKEITSQYYFFSTIYTLMALVTIRLYLPRVLELVRSGDWLNNIEEMYDGKTIYPYSNMIEYVCIQFVSYTRMLALILGFAMLRKRKDVLRGIILIVVAFGSAVITGLYISSRGTVVNYFLLVVSIFAYFRTQYDKKIRFGLFSVFVGFLVIIIPIMLAITISRFTDKQAGGTLIRYFGQAPIVFSGGVSGITKYSYGAHGFGPLLNIKFSQNAVGGSWGTGFFTFVGWLYLDWGPLGSIIVAALISYVIWMITQKKEHELSDLYIIFFTYYTLLQGVFVIGSSYCYQIVMTVGIYIFLKLFSDKKEYFIRETYFVAKKRKTTPATCKYLRR